jgi:epoxyqueuosine reductase
MKKRALAEGFADVGVCRPDAVPEIAERLADFVGAGYHGDMSWMAERMAWRGNPAALWPEAKSVIMLAEPYTPAHEPMAVLGEPAKGAISVYAQNRDYHDIVKKRLKRVGRWLIEEFGGEIKVFVDTAPVMEKPLAAASGLGWQGKHTNLVSRELGSWFFLGAIFTTLELEEDEAGAEHCGSCRACLEACPTGAFVAPYRLDARACISYLTIEHKGAIPVEFRAAMGNRIYGCDDCLAVCPWNKFAVQAQEARYMARDDLAGPDLEALAGLDDAAFRAKFAGSPVKRVGRVRFLRNVAIAMGNAGEARFIPALERLSREPDPVLAEAARWGLGCIRGI